MYSNGEPVAVNADGDTSYFGTDILGSVRSVTDKYGAVKAQYEYDAFGAPYLSNLENDVGFGYCGKVYDSATGLYDYGFRDYNSASARFITVDPIRDGSNWYSYCMNDAVNYVDLFGLCGSDITFSSSVFNNPIIGNDLISNNWIVGDGWAIATSGATLNGLTQTTGVPWTTTSWNQSRNPTTLQIGETITWNTSLPFSNVTFSEGSTSTTSPAITAQSFSQSSNFASSSNVNGISYFSDSSNMSMSTASTPIVESTGSVILNGYASSIFNESELKQISQALNIVKNNIRTMYEDSIKNNISSKTVKSAKEWLGLDLNNSNDLKIYSNALSKMNSVAQTLNMTNFKDGYHSEYAAYVQKNDISHTIYLTKNFKSVLSNVTNTTPEGTIFHELSHFNDTISSNDVYKTFPNFIRWSITQQTYFLKGWNYLGEAGLNDLTKREYAQNWEKFYIGE